MWTYQRGCKDVVKLLVVERGCSERSESPAGRPRKRRTSVTHCIATERPRKRRISATHCRRQASQKTHFSDALLPVGLAKDAFRRPVAAGRPRKRTHFDDPLPPTGLAKDAFQRPIAAGRPRKRRISATHYRQQASQKTYFGDALRVY